MSEYIELTLDGGRPVSVRKTAVLMFRPQPESIRNAKGIGFHDGSEICLTSDQIDSGGILVDISYDDLKKLLYGLV